VTLNSWYFVAIDYNGALSSGNLQSYLNNQYLGSANLIGSIPLGSSQAFAISYGGGSENFEIANLQIYNTSLSANEIQALYLEGIGGAPIDLQHLVAWYPLNGNGNDYSGNNNGQINNANFVSNWWSGYTPP